MINNNFSKKFIEDVNYQYSHEDINPSFLKDKYSANIFVILREWLRVIKKGFFAIRLFFCNGNKLSFRCNYLFFSSSDNNYRVLKPIQEKMEDKAEIIISTHSSFRKAAFYGMLYSPVIFLRYLQSHGYLKKVYSSEFVSFCCTYGYLIEVKKISKKVQPAFLIIANDHYYEPRAVFRMAQILQIKTVYVQHASVSENFPPLEYDYVFLDGQESLDKYTANDKKCNSVVFLTGSSRFDMIKTLNMNNIGKNDTVVKVGIAINLVDSTKKIEQFIYKLHTHTPQLQITIRPHPRMGISYWEQVVKKYNITLSNPKIENPFQFISQNDYFISGESSFHLDVVLSGKVSYYYNFTNTNTVDVYGYIRMGLVKYFSDDILSKMITKSVNYAENKKLAQYYVANYATPFWGKASDLVALTLEQLHNNKQHPDFWIEKDIKGIKCFVLNQDSCHALAKN